MLIEIPEVLTKEQVKHCRGLLDSTDWVDGKVTAGHQSGRVKKNMQLHESNPVAKEVGAIIIEALQSNPLFMSAALPLKVFPPLFNSYSGGQEFGIHVDNSIRQITGTSERIRTDLSATLFFSEPEDYDGGELVVEDTYGTKSVKLPAGHMILYPSSSLHKVTAVTKGARVSSFFWMQSMVREDAKRALLFDMDNTIQSINAENPDSQHAVELTGVYHNLLRMWADT